jgi:hypothetical protein
MTLSKKPQQLRTWRNALSFKGGYSPAARYWPATGPFDLALLPEHAGSGRWTTCRFRPFSSAANRFRSRERKSSQLRGGQVEGERQAEARLTARATLLLAASSNEATVSEGGSRQFSWVRHLPPAFLIRLQSPSAWSRRSGPTCAA